MQCSYSAVEPFPVRAAGEDRWLENTAAALRTLHAGRQWAGPVVLVLPAHLTLIKQCRAPRVEPAKRDQVIRFEAAQAIPYALTDVVWDSVISGETEAGQEVMLAVVKRDILEQLGAAVRAAGFTPGRILPSALATLAGFRLAQPRLSQPVLVLNLGARSTTLLQVQGKCFLARTLPIGGGGITQQLAENQDCDPDEAERIKLSERSADLVAEGRETLATRLAQEITRSVMHFGRQSGMANPAHIFLTGGGARLAGFSDLLATRLKVPVEHFAAPVGVESGAASALTLTDLVGAASIALQPAQPALDLMIPGLRQQKTGRHRQPWLIAAAVLAVAAVVVPLMHYRQVAVTARAKTVALEEMIAPLRAREARNREKLARLELLKAQLARLQSLHDRRTGWLQLLAGLEERLVKVEDVWLEKLQTIPPAEGSPMKLMVSGRMLDKTNPLAQVSPETFTRVKDLLAGIVDLPAVLAVEGERFDHSQPGVLKFDFALVIDPTHPL